jgi:hypothetical protein
MTRRLQHNTLGILIGLVLLAVARKGFSSDGIPLTTTRRITGRAGQGVGIVIGLFGVLMIYVGGALVVLRGVQLIIPLGVRMKAAPEHPGEPESAISSQAAPASDQTPRSTAFPDETAASVFVSDLLARLNARNLDNLEGVLDFGQILPEGPTHGHIREMMHEDVTRMASETLQIESGDLTAYRLLRMHRDGNEMRALVRVASGDILAYVDLVLHRTGTGDIRVGNIYGLGSGRGIREEFTAMTMLSVPDAKKLAAMVRCLEAQEFQEVLNRYADLPQSVQNRWIAWQTRLAAAFQVGRDAYLSAVEDYRQKYPGDIFADFLWLEQGIDDADPQETLACIDRIDAAVNQDVYTNLLRSRAALAAKDFGKAIEYAKKVIDAEPSLVAPYWAAVYAAAQQGDFAEAVAWMRKVQEVDPNDEYDGKSRLFESSEYAAFIRSEELLQFLSSHGSHTPDGGL